MLHECNTFLRNVENCVSKESITLQGDLYFNINALRTLNFSSETRLGKDTCLKVLHSDNYVPFFFFRF